MGTQDTPPIGTATSLGADADQRDAALIRDLAATLATSAYPGRARRVLREAVWFLWEEPRLPQPLISSKYPTSYPWSPAARAAVASTGRPTGGFGLVIEHAVPRTILITELLTGADTRTVEDVLALLADGTHAAVITRADDQVLTTAGLRDRLPDGADPTDGWARYRAAGLDPAGFAPLQAPTLGGGPCP